MPVRARFVVAALSLSAALVIGIVPGATPAPASASGPRVAIIVGPVGSLTDSYRSRGDAVAEVAEAAGATVVKAYSPNATWSAVKAAVNGANVIVYFGHGNGYPNPYSTGENIDRVNGWGLNRTTTNGDGDNWSTTMAYCGEKALLGNLTGADDSVRLNYCGGTANDGINPAPGFVMVYGQAHYTPGFGERYEETDPLTTLSEAQQRVRHYSYPVLALGAAAYYATAYGDADEIVGRILGEPETPFGQIFASGEGYSPGTLTETTHPDLAGAEVWVQRTEQGPSMHFGDPDYWYAFAGDPDRTPSGSIGPFNDIYGSPFYDDILWLVDQEITSGCGGGTFCPKANVSRAQMASFLARALDLPDTSGDFFWDDDGLAAEGDINRLAAAGISGGCADGRFCPENPVRRDEMASFIRRALELSGSPSDFFWDDDGLMAEGDINSFANAGVTAGCGAGAYCPTGFVTRGQMAAFLRRALE